MVLILSLCWIFLFFRNFVFSGCPVWPRFAPTALDTASDLRHDLAEKTGMTTSTKTLPSKSSSFLPWNSCCHSALVPAFSSHFPSILGSRFRRLVPHCDSPLWFRPRCLRRYKKNPNRPLVFDSFPSSLLLLLLLLLLLVVVSCC